MSQASPPTLIDWLCAELDKKLESLPSDQARHRTLILQGNVWRDKYAAFAARGVQPFGEPHPTYGEMTAYDFALLLCAIDERKNRLVREAA
jgi:hypothetical protein